MPEDGAATAGVALAKTPITPAVDNTAASTKEAGRFNLSTIRPFSPVRAERVRSG